MTIRTICVGHISVNLHIILFFVYPNAVLITTFFAEPSLDWKPSNFLQRKRENWYRPETLLCWLFLLLLSFMQREIPRVCADTAKRGLLEGCLWLCRDMPAWKFIANNDKRMVNLDMFFLFFICLRGWHCRSKQVKQIETRCVEAEENNQTFVEPRTLSNQKKMEKNNFWKYRRST